jgi:phosphate transport system substrate-binding protein
MLLEKQAHARPPVEPVRPPLDPDLPEFGEHSECQAWLRCVESETTVDLVDRWITGFQRYHPEIRIDVFIGGSVAVGPALADAWTDFAVASRELAPMEQAPFERTFGYTDTTVVIVHEKNPLDGLSLRQLAAIFGEAQPDREQLETWGQLGIGGEWSDRPLHLWAPKPENGFGHFVRERVLRGGRFRPGISVRERVNPIPAAVADDPDAMGIVGLGHIVPGVKVLGLAADDTAPVAPTLETVGSRRYPLARSIYLMLNVRPGERLPRPLELFVRYILSRDGQQAVLDDGIFLPLPAAAAERELTALG